MSKASKRPHAVVAQIARKLVDKFRPECVTGHIEIAGSLRRNRPMVSDIEIVAFPLMTPIAYSVVGPPTCINRLTLLLNELENERHITKRLNKKGNPIAWGERWCAFVLTTVSGAEYAVDVFMAERETWANTLLIRTGSAEFSAWLVRSQAQGGACPPGMHFADSRLWRGDEPLVTPSEDSIFEALGLPVIPVGYRDNNDWLRYMRQIRLES